MDNEDFLWAGIPFLGGIGGYQDAPCGVVSASAVCIGLRHRCPLKDKKQAGQARNLIRTFSARIVSEFNRQFGDITCRGLIGMDFSKPGEYEKFLQSGIWKDRCVRYVEFMVEKLYALEDHGGLFVMAP
ncbi:MAG: C_GCAxxG_C_C family protein [Deltaproteobacteria bacterium]|nr:C_GCAxxG_C_C family protein [Deltaproteobacteria bacterium]MBW2049865.1 C_GCAxxG_C_C family protein [Deltaproteobacteria bacterium]MBW2354985.1 C_GCAxxG_C_C family protein [Deltaproteobacteria bacterium]